MGFLEVLKTGLAGSAPTHYYPLDNNFRMQDAIGTVHGQNVGGVTWTTDAKSAAKFTGQNWVEIPDDDAFSVGGTTNAGTMTVVSFLTIDQWSKPTNTDADAQRVYWLGKFRQNGEREWTQAMYWTPDPSGEGRAGRTSIYHNWLTPTPSNVGQGVGQYFEPGISGCPTTPAGTEIMVVSRFQGQRDTAPTRSFFMDIWRDNVRWQPAMTSSIAPNGDDIRYFGPIGGKVGSSPGISPVRIGCSQAAAAGNTWGLIGRIRRVAFFDHILSPQDMTTIYQSRGLIETDGTPPPPPPPPPPPVETGTITISSMGISSTFVVDSMNGTGFAPPPPQVVTAPPAPLFSAVAGNNRIDYVWSPNGDGGSPITGYTMTVTSSVPTEAPRTFSFGATSTTFSLTAVTNGRTYTSTLSAINSLGVGSPATTISIPAPPPVPPGPVTGLVTSPLDSAARVSYTAPTDTGTNPITGYLITATAGGATLTYNATTTSPTLNGLTNGLTYAITVLAVSDAGNSTPSTAFATPSATPASETRPDAVSNLVLTPYRDALTATWTAPTFFGSQAFSDYLIIANDGHNQYYYSTTSRSATLGGLRTNSTVNIQIYTRTGAGRSPLVTGTADLIGAPEAPANVIALEPYVSEPLTPTPGPNTLLPQGYVPPATVPLAGGGGPPEIIYTAAPAGFIYAFPRNSMFHPANFGQLNPVITEG